MSSSLRTEAASPDMAEPMESNHTTAPVARTLSAYPELASTITLPPASPFPPLAATPPSRPGGSSNGLSESPAPAKSAGKSTSKGSGKSGSARGGGTTAKRGKPVPPPKLLKAPPPRYPAKAKAGKISGKAAVLIQVRADGSAAATSLFRSSGNAELDQAAVAGARSWKFSATPTLGGGETIPVVVNVTFSP